MDVFVRILDIQPLLNSSSDFSLSKCQKIEFTHIFEESPTQKEQNTAKHTSKMDFCPTFTQITPDFAKISYFSPCFIPCFSEKGESFASVVDRLSDFYKNYILSAKNPTISVEKLAVSLLIYDFFNERYGISPPALCKSESGKPYFADFPVALSVSHTNGLTVCAFAESKDAPASLGIDAEALPTTEKYHSLKRIAERFFDTSQELAGLSEEEFCDEFTLLWTKKESLVKMTGEGIGAIKKEPISEYSHASYKLFRDNEKRKYYISVSCTNGK